MWNDETKTECRLTLWSVVEQALRISTKIDEGAAAIELQPLFYKIIGTLEKADMLAADAAFDEEVKRLSRMPNPSTGAV